MSADDVERVTWHDRDGDPLTTYTVHDEGDLTPDALAIVTRNPVTLALYCHKCHVGSRTPCQHIEDVISSIHLQQRRANGADHSSETE